MQRRFNHIGSSFIAPIFEELVKISRLTKVNCAVTHVIVSANIRLSTLQRCGHCFHLWFSHLLNIKWVWSGHCKHNGQFQTCSLVFIKHTWYTNSYTEMYIMISFYLVSKQSQKSIVVCMDVRYGSLDPSAMTPTSSFMSSHFVPYSMYFWTCAASVECQGLVLNGNHFKHTK